MRRKLYLHFILATALFITTASHAQLTITNNDTTICSGASVTLNSQHIFRTPTYLTLTDDWYSPVIPLGFSFTFYGTTYTSCVISSNGYISFNTAAANTMSQWQINSAAGQGGIPGNVASYNSILAAYADWYPPVGGTIDYATMGTPGNRKFIVTFCAMPMFGCTSLIGTFQAILYEGTNIIDIHIGRKPICNTHNGGSSIEGLQLNSSIAHPVPQVNPFAPFRNYPYQWTAYHSSHRFTPVSTTNYTITGIPYSPIPTSAPYVWYANGVTPLGSTASISVTPASTTFYTVRKVECTDTLSDTVVVTVINPVISSTSFSNPTTCGGSDGTITLNGLSPNTSYTINYSLNSTPQAPLSITSGATGSVVIPALVAGTYSSITTSSGPCLTPAVGPITLVSPAPIVTASSNSPVCQNDSLKLFANTLSGATYSWTGPAFSSNAQNPVILNAQGTNAGTYTVMATVPGCPPSSSGTTVVVDPRPAITSVTSTNPTVCAGTTGTITLGGLSANTTYSVSYQKNSASQGPVILTSNASGSLTIGGLSAGTYSSIIITLGGCGSLPAGPVTLSDPNPPPTPVVTTNSPVCEGGTIILNTTAVPSATYAWTGPGTFSSALQNPTISPAQVTNGGIYSLTVTINGCTSAPGSATVVVNPTPVITGLTTTNPTTCGGSNGTVTINGGSANTTYNVTYSKNSVPQPTASILSGATGSVVVTGLTAGTYNNFIITVNGCSSLSGGSVTLIDPPVPAAPVVSNNGPICQGAALNLTAAPVPGATYSWTGPSFASALQNPVINNAQPVNSGVYSLTVTVNNCTSAASATTATVNPIPATTAGSNSPLCEGATLNLTATTYPGASYSWSGPSFASNTQNPAIPNTATTASGIYTVTSSLNGCTAISSTTVSVTPLPAAPSGNNVTYCQSAPSAPLTATGLNILWYTNPTGGTGTVVAPTPSTSSAGTFTWYVTQSQNGCESPRTPVTATVTAKPQQPVVTSPLSYCQYAPSGALSALGQNLKWYTSLTGGSGTTVAPVPSTSASGTESWFVSQTVNGCESDRAIITVIINAKPSAPGVTTPVLYCKDDPALPLTAQGQGLLWYMSSTGGIGSPTSPTPSTATIGSTYFYVSQSVLSCESDRSAIEVQVNDKRDITLTLDKQSVCQSDTVVASAIGTNPPGTNYLWSFDGGTVLSGTGIGPYLIKWTSPGTKTVIVSSVDAGCIAVDSAVITVSPAPSASFVLESDACLGEQISVQAAWGNLGNSAYTWDFGDAIVLNGSGPGAYKIKWNEVGPHVISLVTLEKGCPSEIFYDTIIVHPDPVAKIEAEKTSNICSGDLIKLNALNSSANDYYNYLWSPKEYFTLAGLQNTVATVKATGFIKLLVEDPYGCTGTDSIYLQTKPCCDIYLPDAFSPNGDGLNDVFRAITIGHHKLTDFRIMNRWGQAVYVGGDIKFGWDGTLGGEPQPIGTYFYYLRYQCGTGEVIEKMGELTLIR